MKKRVFSILLSLCMLLSVLPCASAAASEEDFPDMPSAEHWSHDALSAAVKNGLLNGAGGYIMPGKSLSRAEMAAVVNRAFGAQEEADVSAFSDVDKGAWYAADIAKAVAMGTFLGSGSDAMRPDDPVTRQEAFLVLARAFKLADGDINTLNIFSDHDRVAAWAAPALAAMVSADYVSGSVGKLSPASFISRAEFARVMYNMASVYISAAGTYTDVADGNVIVNVPGVTLKNATVSGDLIIGEGAGNGDVTLDGVKVEGRLVVRGGGENSIHIINSSDVGSIVVGKTASGGIRIKAEEGCRVDVVYVDDGSDEVILEGVYNNVNVADDIPVTLSDAKVTTLSVTSQSANITLTGASSITAANIDKKAEGAKVTVSEGAKIAKIESAAPKVVIQGGGTVTEAIISGSYTAVNTKDTDIKVSEGTSGVTGNGKEITSDTADKDDASNPGGGYYTGNSAAVHTAEEFVAAANNSAVTEIVVADEFTVDTDVVLNKPVTINQNAALGIGAAAIRLYSTITNNGILATVSVPGDGVEGKLFLSVSNIISGNIGKVINNGSFINNGYTELVALTSVVNNGTFENGGAVGYTDLVGLKEREPDKNALYEAVRIRNITDNGGDIVCTAVAFGIKALQSALARNTGDGSLYYSTVSVPGSGAAYTADENLTVRNGQKLVIEKDAALAIPAGMSLTIAGGGKTEIFGALTIGGTAVNNGLYILRSGGVITGTIADEGSGKHYTGYIAADSDDLTAAVADPTCCFAEITGDVAVSSDTDLRFGLVINENASLTINNGVTLTIKTGNDDIIGNPYIGLIGTLDNNGTVVVEPGTGIFARDGKGTLINEHGLLDVYGWMNIDYKSVGGAVNSYANLIDAARVLWNRLGGLLPENVDENTDYDDYSEVLSRLDGNDIEGKFALTWLFKNEVLSAVNFDPYKYADGSKIGALLESFAEAAGKSYKASITGGVLTSDNTVDHGNSLDLLIDSFVTALGVGSMDVGSEADLRNCLGFNFVDEIHITSDIALSDNLTITKHVAIETGSTLTVAASKNLTVDFRKWAKEQEGCRGVLVIDGTLAIPSGSNVMNKGEVDLSGTIENGGTFTNMTDELGRQYNSNFFGEGGTIQNTGVIAANGNMMLSGTKFINGGGFTNNGNLEISGGSIASTAPFHNAGYMMIGDEYYDSLSSGSSNVVVDFSFGNTLTDNSRWIDYTAKVYTADGLSAALASQEVKKETLGDQPPKTGLETYNRMSILGDIELTGNTEFSGWDVWVETDTRWDEDAQTEIRDPYTLTIGNDASLTVIGRTLHVNGELINEGTLTLGAENNGGGLQIWPTGSFSNSGSIEDTYGYVFRMDEYKGDGTAELMNSAVITGYSGAQDIAIVHDWASLYNAAAVESDLYDRIDILGDDCDIVLGSDLAISANVYIEWNDGIEIPEGKTLSLTGGHWLNNSGDIWVFGTLNIGAGNEVNNDSNIQIDGIVSNNGIINNKNSIAIMSGGSIGGSGLICSLPDSALTGSVGTISCAYCRLAENEVQLRNALNDGVPALIAGDVILTDDMTLNANVTVGLENFRNGSLRTGEHSLAVAPGNTLAVKNGELEVGENGSFANEGSLTIGENSLLRIRTGGTMTTVSDVYINGRMELYDWENRNDYILGPGMIFNYANECELIHHLYRFLYESDSNGLPTGVKGGIVGVTDFAEFNESSELAAIGTTITGWDKLTSDNPDLYSQYAYAALKLNGIIGDAIEPYEKLTYAGAKELFSAIADKLNADITSYLDKIPNTANFICNSNASAETGSDLDELCQSFGDALASAIAG